MCSKRLCAVVRYRTACSTGICCGVHPVSRQAFTFTSPISLGVPLASLVSSQNETVA
jgi:hypothetical protein